MNPNANNATELKCLRCGRKESERKKSKHDCFYSWDCAMGCFYKWGLQIKKEQKKKYLREKNK
jgi:hypothetical protein